MAEAFPSHKLDQFLLRLPEGMREKISAAARANNRTMTAEIVSCLTAHYSAESPPAAADVSPAKIMAELSAIKEHVIEMDGSLELLRIQLDEGRPEKVRAARSRRK